MSKLNFAADLGPNDLSGLDLPVEVRAQNLALVSRGMASQPIDVDPGKYHVTAKLPAGQQLYCEVEVRSGQDATAVLTPELTDLSPHEWQAKQHFFLKRPLIATNRPLLESLGGGVAQVKLRAFTGNPIRRAHAPAPASVLRVGTWSSNAVQFKVSGASGVTLIQLLQPDLPVTNKTVPVWGSQECTFQVTRLDNGRFAIETHLMHSAAELLLRYRDKGYLQQASSAVSSSALDAEHLLSEKASDPIAAAVGAYTLLRLGDIERLHNWTENLLTRFPEIPDSAVIRAEHLALIGEHHQALDVLQDLPSRGIPIFTDGFSYAMDRLRLYAGQGGSTWGAQDMDRATSILMEFDRYVAFTDFRRSFTSFSGLDPGTPGDTPPNVPSITDNVLDLALYFA